MTNGFLPPEESLEKLWPVQRWRGLTVVASVSGGADSVAVLRLLEQRNKALALDASIVVAHYNHQLRGIESDQDEEFVRDLAAKLDLPIVVQRAELLPRTERDEQRSQSQNRSGREGGLASMGEGTFGDIEPAEGSYFSGSEEQWRQDRYRFLEQTANRLGARYVVLGHHGEDRVETLVHHLFRGTGVEGLSTMRPFRLLGQDLVIARPLLLSSRESIRAYLRSIQQSFREDSSNVHRGFSRNRVRHDLLPAIQEAGYSQYAQALLRLAEQATEIQQWLEASVDEIFEALVTIQRVEASSGSADVVRATRKEIAKLPWPMQRTLLARIWKDLNWSLGAMTQSHWYELRRLFAAENAVSVHLPGAIEVRSDGAVVWMRKVS